MKHLFTPPDWFPQETPNVEAFMQDFDDLVPRYVAQLTNKHKDLCFRPVVALTADQTAYGLIEVSGEPAHINKFLEQHHA